MGLIVALDDNSKAAGELFWDDGDSRGIVAFFLISGPFVCKCAAGYETGIIGTLLLPLIIGVLL